MKEKLQEAEANLIVKTSEFEAKLEEKELEFQENWKKEREEQNKIKNVVENLENSNLIKYLKTKLKMFQTIKRKSRN